MRLVICSVAGAAGYLELPESRVGDTRAFISGGERSLYELAVAAASLGMDVELRGAINESILRTLTAAAGAGPTVGLDPRPPDPKDVIVVPETVDRDTVATMQNSSAKWVLFLLGPPGLFGWSFRLGWAPCDPLLVPIESVGTAATFEAIESFGFGMWTNALGIAAAGGRAGVGVEWLGSGTPVPFPEPPRKTFDVAVVDNNRWIRSARDVVDGLAGVTVKRIPAIPHAYSLCEALGPARILVWPSRIEGRSRISREARGVATIPVSLDTNPFATRADHGEGVVLVHDLEEMTREVRVLLDDPHRLEKLATEAVEGAKAQVDWGAFVVRVEAAVSRVGEAPSRPSDFARESVSDHLRERERVQAERAAASVTTEVRRHEVEISALSAERSELVSTLARVTGELDVTAACLEDARSELVALRARLSIRLLDGALGRAWGALRRRTRRRVAVVEE